MGAHGQIGCNVRALPEDVHHPRGVPSASQGFHSRGETPDADDSTEPRERGPRRPRLDARIPDSQNGAPQKTGPNVPKNCVDPSLPSRLTQILRNQPDNIYEYGAKYFEDLIEENKRAAERVDEPEVAADDEDAGASAQAGWWNMGDEELQDFIMDRFMEYDDDQDGYLDRHEFKTLLTSTDLGLSTKDVRRIMSEADENEDGVLEYREFVPIMVELIHSMKAKEDAKAAAEEDEVDAREAVEMHLLHGIPREQLEQMMFTVFNSADSDGSGALDRKEFARCLKSAELGLTRKEINLLLSEVDADGDGMVTYEEFVPLCFNILVERFKDDVLAEQALNSYDDLTQTLLEEFQSVDEDDSGGAATGRLKFRRIRHVLDAMSEEMLGLSRLQIASIMSEAKVDEETEEVEYATFASTAARMIYSMVDLAAQAVRVDAVAKVAETEGAEFLNTLDEETIKDVLAEAFEEADKDGNGVLDVNEVQHVLKSLGVGQLALKPGEINAMIAAIDADEDGTVNYAELVDFLFDVLNHLERERWIKANAFSDWYDVSDDGVGEED